MLSVLDEVISELIYLLCHWCELYSAVCCMNLLAVRTYKRNYQMIFNETFFYALSFLLNVINCRKVAVSR